MSDIQPKKPLHDVTLEMILTGLVEHRGWVKPGQTINLKCFIHEPGIEPCLKFLRPPGQGDSGRFIFAPPGFKRLRRL